MKQRTRLLHSGDDLLTNMNASQDDKGFHSEIQLYRIKPQDHFIEAQVHEGDTLQAIALRFHCSISELKRINHIHKDNEIFARRTIKVPVTPYSVLTEIVPTVQTLEPIPSTSTDSASFSVNNVHHSPDNRLPHNKDITIPNSADTKDRDFSIDCNAIILNSTLAPSVVPYTDNEQNESISEDTRLLPNNTRDPVEAVVVKQLTSQGADFGLKWFHLVGFVLILCVLTPIIIILFSIDKHEHS